MTAEHPDCCRPAGATSHDNSQHSTTRAGLWAAGGSVLSAVIASACCWLPLLLVALGVSAAGASAAFEKVRPLFLTLCMVLLAAGFFFLYVRRKACAPGSECVVPGPKLKGISRNMLWVATACVVAFAFFPKYAGLLPGTGNGNAMTAEMQRGVMRVEGMTCEGCAATVEKAIYGVPGVLAVQVDFPKRQALVGTNARGPVPRNEILAALEKAGYAGAFVEPEK